MALTGQRKPSQSSALRCFRGEIESLAFHGKRKKLSIRVWKLKLPGEARKENRFRVYKRKCQFGWRSEPQNRRRCFNASANEISLATRENIFLLALIRVSNLIIPDSTFLISQLKERTFCCLHQATNDEKLKKWKELLGRRRNWVDCIFFVLYFYFYFSSPSGASCDAFDYLQNLYLRLKSFVFSRLEVWIWNFLVIYGNLKGNFNAIKEGLDNAKNITKLHWIEATNGNLVSLMFCFSKLDQFKLASSWDNFLT